MNIENIFITIPANRMISKNVAMQPAEPPESKSTDSSSFEFSNMDLMNVADKVYRRIDNLRTNYQSLDRMNARNVVSLASSVICKGNNIHTNLSNLVYKFQTQISKILCSGATEEAIESKIRAIENKMNAAAKEANAKMDILISLSDSLFKLGNIALDMKNSDMDSYNGVDFIKQLIEKLDTKVDDFSKTNIDNKEEINEKILKDLDNVYGKESQKMLEKKKKEFEEKIDEIQDCLQNPNLPKEEINRLKVLLELYNHRINAILNILDILNNFSEQNKEQEQQV